MEGDEPVKSRLFLMRRSSYRTCGLVVFLILYLCIGALIFSIIEGPHETSLRDLLQTVKRDFMSNNTCITDDELEQFLEQVIAANNRGVSIARNSTSEPNWSFGQSLFFAGTIITTIGYGRVTPLSEGGKIFCIVYASIGIPLTLIMFTALVERLMIATNALLRVMTTKLGSYYKTLQIRLVHLLIILLLLVVFVILIPSAIFAHIEDKWNFLDGFYYCFISMTTIGLGDYVPGDDPDQVNRPLYKIITTFYLFIGLTMMMLMLATIYDIPELNIGYHFYMCSDDDVEENASTSSCDNQEERAHLRSSGEKPKMYTEQDNSAFQSDANYRCHDDNHTEKH